MTFSVDENVLIPRQDTETLVERVLRDYPEKDLKLLDMCTGSGLYRDQPCRAWRLPERDGGGYFRGGAARGKEKCETSLFDSEGNCAVRIVSGIGGSVVHPPENVAGKGTAPAGRDRGTQPDTFAEQSVSGRWEADVMYDVIVSNPPYIPSAVIDGLEPEVRDHEPRLALDGSEDGLYFYRVLALECSKHLNKGGCVYFEIGYDQAEAVSRILTIAGYREIEVIKDEPGLNRVVKARWNR